MPLRRAGRPFDIIRIPRAASQLVTAAAIRSVMLAFDEPSSHVATKTTELTTARAFNGVRIAVTATVGWTVRGRATVSLQCSNLGRS